jgi:hypothetical protein
MDKLIVQRVKVEAFSNFIEKVLSIDKFIYIKVAEGNMTSNCYLPERDAVKLHSVPVDEILETESLPDKQLKIAFLNGSHTVDALKHFVGTTVSAEINYKLIGDEYIAISIDLISDELTVTLPCSDPSLGFMDMSVDQIKAVFDTSNPIFTFDVQPFNIDNLNSLFRLEKENEVFNILNNNTGIRFKGKTYNRLVTEENATPNETSITFYKRYLNFLDKESYNVSVFEHKAVWRSLDSNTLLCIATCSDPNA